MVKSKSTRLGAKIWASVLICGLIGQIAWIIENMYFATFAQDLFEDVSKFGNNYYIATTLMVILSAVTATVTTIFAGAFSDKLGKRKVLITVGYLVWGVTIMLFAVIPVDFDSGKSGLIIALLVIFDCVMTFAGSTANDAAFNAWITDVTDGTNRGKVNTILSVMPVIATVAAIAIAMFTYDKGNYTAFFIILGVIPIAAGVVSIFLVKDAPGIVRSDMRTAKDVFYGFRPSVVKSNKMMFVCLTALCLVGISQQTQTDYVNVERWRNIAAHHFLNLTAHLADILALCHLQEHRAGVAWRDEEDGTAVLAAYRGIVVESFEHTGNAVHLSVELNASRPLSVVAKHLLHMSVDVDIIGPSDVNACATHRYAEEAEVGTVACGSPEHNCRTVGTHVTHHCTVHRTQRSIADTQGFLHATDSLHSTAYCL